MPTESPTEPPASQVHSRSFSTAREDELLLAGLLADQGDAWRALEKRYSRLILSCISRVTIRFGSVRPDDVEEIHATLVLELLANDKRKLRSFEPGRGARLGTWLGMLATHAAYDFLRRLRREPRADDLEALESLCAETPDPSDQTLLHERARLVGDIVAQLSQRDREFVRLYYSEDLEPEEIARRMGISVKTVYTRKHKLQGRLESLLTEERRAA
jgi:RNA polymerase sigma-70 factor, ECF subfamily